MSNNEPSRHHYAPQFYLRNFASDAEKQKLWALAKEGDRIVWRERSISTLGYEQDFYVHFEHGVPVSVETDINRFVETPISGTETWSKIVAGRTDELDATDKPILYALIRHLEARTPHRWQTMQELTAMAEDSGSILPFSEEERAGYTIFRENPDLAKAFFNEQSASLGWAEENYEGCGMTIMRSHLPFRSSTTPVMSIPAPPNPALSLPLPGMTPYQFVMALEPHTAVSLVLGRFSDGFANMVVPDNVVHGLNRHFAAYFSKFDYVRHLVSSRERLIEDMIWAPYDLCVDTPKKIVLQRRSGTQSIVGTDAQYGL